MSNTSRLFLKNGELFYNDSNSHSNCNCTYTRDGKYAGLSVQFAEPCTECNSKGWVKGTRGGKPIRKKCPSCKGSRYIYFDEPKVLGKCPECKGSLKKKPSITDNVHIADKRFLFNLIDFDSTTGSANTEQTFNEGYLGIGLIGGITDYGRYLKMNQDEFKMEVHKHFVDSGFLQYAHIVKDGNVLSKIRLHKNNSGWSLIPVFKQ